MLTDPARFGGDPVDAVHRRRSVAAGLYLFVSTQPKRFRCSRWPISSPRSLTDVLAYPRFAAQAGDWGAFVTSYLGRRARRHAHRTIHVNLLACRATRRRDRDARAGRARVPRELDHWLREETGYQAAIQGTRPQTLGFGLTIPVGLRRVDRREVPRVE